MYAGGDSMLGELQIEILQQFFVHMSRPERRLVKKTVIPVSIVDEPKQISGLVHFPTQTNPKSITPHFANAVYKKNSIMYRNQLLRENEPQEEDTRRREVQLYDVTINPVRSKQKQYKLQIPIARGTKFGKNSHRSNELYFSFTFTNSEGRLVLMSGIQDAKMDIITRDKDEKSRKRVQQQIKKLDGRIKDAYQQNFREEPENEK